MTEKGEKLLVRLTLVFLVTAVAGMVWIRSLQQTEAKTAAQEAQAELSAESFEAIEGEDADIIIPLPDTGDDGFHVEEDLKNKRLTIVLEGVWEDWFYENKIKGDQQKISQVLYRQDIGETELQFILNDIYEADFLVQDGELRLMLENPTKQWEHIVVLEGEAFDADAVEALEEQGIKGFNSGDVATANELRADAFVSLSAAESGGENRDAAESADSSGAEITIYYNDEYYIPDFDSESLANLLAAYLAEEYGAEQVALVRTSAWDLEDAMIPAVKIVYNPAADISSESDAAARTDETTASGAAWADETASADRSIAALTLEAITSRYESVFAQ